MARRQVGRSATLQRLNVVSSGQHVGEVGQLEDAAFAVDGRRHRCGLGTWYVARSVGQVEHAGANRSGRGDVEKRFDDAGRHGATGSHGE